MKSLKRLHKYSTFAFIVTVLSLYSFLIFQIGNLSHKEPEDYEVTEQLNTVKRLKIDQDTIDKIEQLEDQNIGVQSLFKAARDDPFRDE